MAYHDTTPRGSAFKGEQIIILMNLVSMVNNRFNNQKKRVEISIHAKNPILDKGSPRIYVTCLIRILITQGFEY